MKLIFKINDNAANPAVVGDSNFSQHYSGINVAMAWEELVPAITHATRIYVLRYIGEALYNDIAEKYHNNTTLTAAQATLLELLQGCIANYTIWHIMPEKSAVVSSMGVMTQSPSDGATPPSQWSFNQKRQAALDNADTLLDLTLKHLEKQVKAAVAYFDLWKNDEAYQVKKSDFFRQTEELDEYLNIQQSRRSFISIIRYISEVEETRIKPVLCDTLYNAVVSNPTSAENAALIPLIRKAAAYLGAAEAIPHHRIITEGDGFRVVSFTDGFTDRRNQTNNIHQQAIGALLDQCEKRGAAALKALRDYLEANLSTYPAYRDSTCRVLPDTKAHTIVQSPDGIGAVGIF